GVGGGAPDPGAQTGDETTGGASARGRGQEQITQVGGEHAHTLVLGLLPQAHTHVDVQTHQNAGSPRPTHRVLQPPVGGTAPVDEVEVGCDRILVKIGRAHV